MKTALITPVYKKGKRSDYNNYRPIGILPCVEKVLEIYLNEEITKYIKKI